jgi:hypothetical protein
MTQDSDWIEVKPRRQVREKAPETEEPRTPRARTQSFRSEDGEVSQKSRIGKLARREKKLEWSATKLREREKRIEKRETQRTEAARERERQQGASHSP